MGEHEVKSEPGQEDVGGEERTQDSVLGTQRAELCGHLGTRRPRGQSHLVALTSASLADITLCSSTSVLPRIFFTKVQEARSK